MGLCYSSVMKTTVEIADALLAEAKKFARERDITLRELIESGLRKELAEINRCEPPFVWRHQPYGDPKADGWLNPPFSDGDWRTLREVANERDDSD